MLSLIPDLMLRKEMGEDLLRPLLDHDREHGSNYIERSVTMKPTYAGKIKNLGTQVVEALFKGGSTKSGKVKTGKDLRSK